LIRRGEIILTNEFPPRYVVDNDDRVKLNRASVGRDDKPFALVDGLVPDQGEVFRRRYTLMKEAKGSRVTQMVGLREFDMRLAHWVEVRHDDDQAPISRFLGRASHRTRSDRSDVVILDRVLVCTDLEDLVAQVQSSLESRDTTTEHESDAFGGHGRSQQRCEAAMMVRSHAKDVFHRRSFQLA
jgi:hypothetical protein